MYVYTGMHILARTVIMCRRCTSLESDSDDSECVCPAFPALPYQTATPGVIEVSTGRWFGAVCSIFVISISRTHAYLSPWFFSRSARFGKCVFEFFMVLNQLATSFAFLVAVPVHLPDPRLIREGREDLEVEFHSSIQAAAE